jgi:hypothetical protein
MNDVKDTDFNLDINSVKNTIKMISKLKMLFTNTFIFLTNVVKKNNFSGRIKILKI